MRESSNNLDEVLDDKDFVLSAQGTPVLVNSIKLGESLQSFVPEEKLEIVCKLGYVQKTFVKPDLSNVIAPTPEIMYLLLPLATPKILFSRICHRPKLVTMV